MPCLYCLKVSERAVSSCTGSPARSGPVAVCLPGAVGLVPVMPAARGSSGRLRWPNLAVSRTVFNAHQAPNCPSSSSMLPVTRARSGCLGLVTGVARSSRWSRHRWRRAVPIRTTSRFGRAGSAPVVGDRGVSSAVAPVAHSSMWLVCCFGGRRRRRSNAARRWGHRQCPRPRPGSGPGSGCRRRLVWRSGGAGDRSPPPRSPVTLPYPRGGAVRGDY